MTTAVAPASHRVKECAASGLVELYRGTPGEALESLRSGAGAVFPASPPPADASIPARSAVSSPSSCVQRGKHLGKGFVQPSGDPSTADSREWNPESRAARQQVRENKAFLASVEVERARRGRRGSARRAVALLACGMCGVAVSPRSGQILVDDATGRPGVNRRSCNDRFCDDCAKSRSTRVAEQLEPIVRSLLAQPEVSDGLVRQLTLTQQDTPGEPVADAGDRLWAAWTSLRQQRMYDLRDCFACFEMTYNHKTDTVHPHLHVIVLGTYIERDRPTGLLATWQRILGYSTVWDGAPTPAEIVMRHHDKDGNIVEGYTKPGSRGGVDLKVKDEIKEAIKYPLKGMSDTLRTMPMDRIIEMRDYLQGKRLLRTYGAFRACADDGWTELSDDEVSDSLLTDPVSGEVWTTAPVVSERAGIDAHESDLDNAGRARVWGGTEEGETGGAWRASWPVDVRDRALDVPIARWSYSRADVERAHELLYFLWGGAPSEAALAKRERRQQRRRQLLAVARRRAKRARIVALVEELRPRWYGPEPSLRIQAEMAARVAAETSRPKPDAGMSRRRPV